MQGFLIQPLVLMLKKGHYVGEFNRTWTASTKVAQAYGYFGDVKMIGERNYLPGLTCESNHKEAEEQTQVTNQSAG